MRVSNKWVIYNDINGAIFFLKNIVTVLFKGRPKFIDAYKITLINPRLHAIINENIIIKKYNMFTPWLEEKVDLIIAANILNQIYFTNAEIILAFEILTSFLNENGRIAIVENRKNEQCSIFHFQNGSMRIEKRIALGTEIESLIMNNSPRN